MDICIWLDLDILKSPLQAVSKQSSDVRFPAKLKCPFLPGNFASQAVQKCSRDSGRIAMLIPKIIPQPW